MKKLFLLGITLISFTTVSLAGKDKPVKIGDMPQKAKEFVTAYFNGAEVAFAKQETDWTEKTYKVLFTDGSSVEFDRKGNWIEIKDKQHGVSKDLLPANVRDFIQQKYPTLSIKEVERMRKTLEVKFTNGMELTFDRKGQLVEADL